MLLRDVKSEHLLPVLSAFEHRLRRDAVRQRIIIAPPQIKTASACAPCRTGFPTDAQAPVRTMAAVGDGTSIFVENIFESRYKHAGELNRLGAKIKLEGKVAVIEACRSFGAPVSAEGSARRRGACHPQALRRRVKQVMHPSHRPRLCAL